MRALLVSLLVAVAGCGGSQEADAPGPRPLLLMTPPGGFILPPTAMTEARGMARRRGFAVEKIDYTLGDPLQAWRDVRERALQARRDGRPVFAYGESAGGVLASLLAKKGIAEAVVSNAAPSNLTTGDYQPLWQYLRNHGDRTRRALSPVFGPTKSPVLVMDTPEVPETFRMNTRWAKRDPMVRFHGYLGSHIYGNDYLANLRVALGFLGEQRRQR